MMTFDEARIRVAGGAHVLDQKVPGWDARINLGTLQLSSCTQCVLGQLHAVDDENGYAITRDKLHLTTPLESRDPDVVRYGFQCSASDESEGYYTLTQAWKELISKRRAMRMPVVVIVKLEEVPVCHS